MDYVNLGRSGLRVSRLCLGTMSYGDASWASWVLGEDDAKAHIKRALDAGVNFFDTADIYSFGKSEEIVGRVLKDLGVRREDVVIATKLYFPMGGGANERGLSRKHMRHAIDDSLRRLGVDYIDLYQMHRFDVHTPFEETLEAFNDVVRAGKAIHVGASSMYAWQFMKALETQKANGWARFASMQNHYNLIYREEEREMLPLCRAEGVGVIPWSPLARGFLTGSRTRGGGGQTARTEGDRLAQSMYSENDFDVVDAVSAVAKQRGLPNAQIALAWVMHQAGVTAPIFGATKLSHLDDAIAATDIKLSEEELNLLQAPYRPHAVLGHSYGDAAELMARARRA
ncbi:MAG: aldo/keto reductase [Alphaproteobacteria bacterium]|nr:aldo/keto reductase [Alphaproteobacteria bacterium]